MKDVHAMECFESVQHLNSHTPDSIFINGLFPFLVALDEATEIAIRCEFCNEEQTSCSLIVDGIFVCDDIGVGDACQYSDLIETIADIFGVAVRNFNLFHGVDETILLPFHLVD